MCTLQISEHNKIIFQCLCGILGIRCIARIFEATKHEQWCGQEHSSRLTFQTAVCWAPDAVGLTSQQWCGQEHSYFFPESCLLDTMPLGWPHSQLFAGHCVQLDWPPSSGVVRNTPTTLPSAFICYYNTQDRRNHIANYKSIDISISRNRAINRQHKWQIGGTTEETDASLCTDHTKALFKKDFN